VVRRKVRLVTFRVSDEEYSQLEQACVRSSSRSISDFARNAVVHAVRVLAAPQGLLTVELSVLSVELTELDTALRDLRQRIQQMLGVAKTERTSSRYNHSNNT
jgi:hypothetical protein